MPSVSGICPFVCKFSLGSLDVYCLVMGHMLGLCQEYVLGICMHDTCKNSLIRIALRVVRLLLELLEAS